MTGPEIEELARLHAASTQGEWEVVGGNCIRGWDQMPLSGPVSRPVAKTYKCSNEPANRAWIAASHNAFPALAAELRRLQKVVEDRDATERSHLALLRDIYLAVDGPNQADLGGNELACVRRVVERMLNAEADAERASRLMLYVKHDAGCGFKVLQTKDGASSCTCGLDSALSPAARDGDGERGAGTT